MYLQMIFRSSLFDWTKHVPADDQYGVTSIGVNDSLASASHGMDESVNCCPGNVAPSLEDGLLHLCGCC